MRLRSASITVFVSASVFFAGEARAAPTLSIVEPTALARLDAGRREVAKRPASMNPEGISKRDCVDDQVVRLPFRLSGFEAGSSLGLWVSAAGTDCAVADNRASTQGSCAPVGAAVPPTASGTIDVPVRELLAMGSWAVFGSTAGDVCNSGMERTALQLQLLYWRAGTEADADLGTGVTIAVDLLGVPPPAQLFAFAGDRKVRLEWAPFGGASSSGMAVRCARVLAGADGASACPATIDAQAGTPDGSSSDTAPSTVVTQTSETGTGTDVDTCGDGTALENGALYAFALSTVDDFGNVGPTSSTECIRPAAGATLPRDTEVRIAEDSGCALSPAPARSGRVAPFVVLPLAAAMARLRRHARKPGTRR